MHAVGVVLPIPQKRFRAWTPSGGIRLDRHPTSMHESREYSLTSKVYYRPIEAAIRWCGLVEHEREILHILQRKRLPEETDFPNWPTLRLNTERIFDAIINRELPCGIDGVTTEDEPCIDDPRLTVRHVDLYVWMSRYYPEHKPRFLFGKVELRTALTERLPGPASEREVLNGYIQQLDREIRLLRNRWESHLKQESAEIGTAEARTELGPRAETAYLHIIGGLLDLLLGHSPSGQAYSSFRTQEAVIGAMVSHHGGRLGISERTLAGKFAAARRALAK